MQNKKAFFCGILTIIAAACTAVGIPLLSEPPGEVNIEIMVVAITTGAGLIASAFGKKAE